jgi:flagellar assembly factor FliW
MSTPAAVDGIITFAEGLPGFEHCRRFVLVAPPSLQPFTVIQGVDDGGPSFVAIDPRRVSEGYPTTLDKTDLARLDAAAGQPLLWLAIVAAHDDGTATANLRAPVIVNPAVMRGIQLIGVDDRYAIDHPLQAA